MCLDTMQASTTIICFKQNSFRDVKSSQFVVFFFSYAAVDNYWKKMSVFVSQPPYLSLHYLFSELSRDLVILDISFKTINFGEGFKLLKKANHLLISLPQSSSLTCKGLFFFLKSESWCSRRVSTTLKMLLN